MSLYILLFVATYIIYHIMYFNQAAYMGNYNKSTIIPGTVVAVINFMFFYIFVFVSPIYFEGIEMLLYVIILTIEFKIIFRTNMRTATYASLIFSLNLYAKKNITMGLMGLITGLSVPEMSQDVNMRIMFFVVPFLVSVFTIITFRKYIKRVHMDTILSDKRNVVFLISIFGSLYLAVAVASVSLGVYVGGYKLLLQYILAGSFCLIAFIVFTMYAYIVASLKINHDNYKRVKKQNEEQLQDLEQLKKQASTDSLTGLFTRKTADDYLQECINNKKSYFLVFMDIDGLKIANDKYGHSEGDFYIKAVAVAIQNYFAGNVVSRYGGDEIVAIGGYNDEEEVIAKTIQCYNAVLNIKNKHKKPYNTSISYGIVTTTSKENFTAKQIIKLADERMYGFKRMNNKAR